MDLNMRSGTGEVANKVIELNFALRIVFLLLL